MSMIFSDFSSTSTLFSDPAPVVWLAASISAACTKPAKASDPAIVMNEVIKYLIDLLLILPSFY